MTLPPDEFPTQPFQSAPPPYPPPAQPPFQPPAQPAVPAPAERDEVPTVLVALGCGLLAAAVTVSAMYSRRTGDLDASNYVVGVLATLVLLAIAGAAVLLAPDAEKRATLVSWPGAFGAVSVGLMLGVLITNDTASTYVAGLAITALSVAGYLLVRQAPFVLSAILGLVLLYGRVFSDIVPDGTASGDNAGIVAGLAVMVFVLVITGAGWFLPETRTLTGVVVGAGGLVGMAVDLSVLVFARSFGGGYFGYGGDDFGDAGRRYADYLPEDPYKNDVYVVLFFCVVLAAVWAVMALFTGHVGFRILLVADAVVIIPLASFAVMAEHPTYWSAVPAVLGAVVLVGIGLQYLSRTRRSAPGQ